MTIDIDRLTEAELIDLNHRIVERLRMMRQLRAHVKMLEFRIGDRVCFYTHDNEYVEGMLTRYNKKSVTVIADTGLRWNVHPSLLRRLDDSTVQPDTKPQPLRLPAR